MALPDFLLIGAPKAGTTALHAALTRAGQFWPPRLWRRAERVTRRRGGTAS